MCWRELMFDAMDIAMDVQQFQSLKRITGVFQTKSDVRFVGGTGIISSQIAQDFPIRIARGRSEISRTPENMVFLHLQNQGRLDCEYAKRRPDAIQAGDWTLGNTSDPYRLTLVPGKASTHVLALPGHLGAGLRVNSDCFGRRMDSNNALNYLVANYIRTLAAGKPIPGAAGDAVLCNLVGLIALAMNSEMEESRKGVSSGMLLVLLQYLDAHYARADLSPAHVAAHFGITPRHVHRLFERTGMTFSEQLFSRRLDHAHRMLSDTRHQHSSITDIAYDVGFSDLAHFSRKYREKFGVTPSETKSKHQSFVTGA